MVRQTCDVLFLVISCTIRRGIMSIYHARIAIRSSHYYLIISYKQIRIHFAIAIMYLLSTVACGKGNLGRRISKNFYRSWCQMQRSRQFGSKLLLLKLVSVHHAIASSERTCSSAAYDCVHCGVYSCLLEQSKLLSKNMGRQLTAWAYASACVTPRTLHDPRTCRH